LLVALVPSVCILPIQIVLVRATGPAIDPEDPAVGDQKPGHTIKTSLVKIYATGEKTLFNVLREVAE
jgi:hypothetical protein